MSAPLLSRWRFRSPSRAAQPLPASNPPEPAGARENGPASPSWPLLPALAAGACNTLSFAPTPHGGWLEIAIFAFLYHRLTRTSGWRDATLTGFAFGFGQFVTGVWWLYVSMHDYGGMPAPLAGAALVLFSLYLAVYPALSAALWSCCAGHAGRDRRSAAAGPPAPAWHAALAFASAWALGEWLRGYVFTGFPWLSSGYAQVDGPLAGFAPLAGVYGVGWLLALLAALLTQTLQAARRAALAPACAVVALIASGLLLHRVHWTAPANAPLDVRLLQGNVKQQMKFEEAGVLAALDEYQRMITARPADLVVTPETAVPLLAQALPPAFAAALRGFADRTGTSILFGAIGGDPTRDGRVVNYTNSLFGITPHTATLYRYDKHHLVPFGEFVPWGFRWFVALMQIPLGDFARGPLVQQPFIVHDQPVAVDICYEDIFGEEIAASLRDAAPPAGILINSTNLAWFGDTIALDQHLQIARMRALETGRPMLRATNTGTTAAIDPQGNVIARLPPFTVGEVDVHVQGTAGRTPYVAAGNSTVLGGSLLLAVVFVRMQRRHGRRRARDAAG